jgi:ABC-2 type transport system permease protein
MNAPFIVPTRPKYRSVSLSRIGAVILRHYYLLRSSGPRLLELIYWPLVQMLVWGFMQTWLLAQRGGAAIVAGTLIGAILLWDVLIRGQQGLSVSFLEEMWSRNVANLFISPLRPGEFLVSLMAMSVIRLMVGVFPVTLLATWFFGFNLWGLGLGLGAFFANLLLTAWATGALVSGLIIRNGLGAEGLAWTLMFLLMPFCAVFYPVEILPLPLQWFAWLLPPTYVFEGMRALIIDQVFRIDLMLWALGINILLIGAACFAFFRLVDKAREAGSMMAIGE